MLKIEDLKVGDELVCIDIEMFERSYGKIKGENLFKVKGLIHSNLVVIGSGYHLSNSFLKHFKKKEEQYTFDDLIDVARKAFDDGVVDHVKTSKGIVFELEVMSDDGIDKRWHHGDPEYSDAIKFIQSLYKETFVIECEEDVDRVKDDCIKIILSNDEIMPKKVFRTLKCEFTKSIVFKCIKGAKVEQSRG